MHVEIASCALLLINIPSSRSLLCQHGPSMHACPTWPQKSHWSRPERRSGLTLPTWILYLTEVVQFSENFSKQYKDPFRSYPRLRHEDPPKPTAPALLTAERHDHAIRESSHAARSSSRSKYYNAHILMRIVMDSGGYLCMTIPNMKRRWETTRKSQLADLAVAKVWNIRRTLTASQVFI